MPILSAFTNWHSHFVPAGTELWVDKYRPKIYADLLSDDWLNQEVITWVKQWHYCVFKEEPKPALRRTFKPFVIGDKFERPERRILLLCGPPGHGKTTLAHVIARQCKYNVVEINAR